MTPLQAGFLSGAITAGFLVLGLCLLRFWTATRERLFLAFAIAFWLMAANQAAPVLFGLARESAGGIYLLRLAAFLVIIVAIVSKNLRDRGRAG